MIPLDCYFTNEADQKSEQAFAQFLDEYNSKVQNNKRRAGELTFIIKRDKVKNTVMQKWFGTRQVIDDMVEREKELKDANLCEFHEPGTMSHQIEKAYKDQSPSNKQLGPLMLQSGA